MADFEQYLKPGKRGHLIGAGGVSMAPLAEVLAGMGLVIDGSDMAESEKTRYLRSLGIDIKIGHSAMNVAPDIQFVVRTAAVRDDNPEIVEAKARGVPVFERAQAWGDVYKRQLHPARQRPGPDQWTGSDMSGHRLGVHRGVLDRAEVQEKQKGEAK